MNTGDKLVEGYKMIEGGKPEGAYLYLEAVAEMFINDEIEDIIYGNLLHYVASMDLKGKTEPDQWLKLVLLDARYGKLMLEPGDLLENLRKNLNEKELHSDEYVIQSMLDGSIGKIKYIDGAYITVKIDYEKNLRYLVRIAGNEMEPLDFDVEDFRINRLAKRVEFNYVRGNKKVMSINPDGSDKRELDRIKLYPEES
ncbi:MAG: hypothetical protein E7241_04315 [Lachnospiraceae bacterium]|nr:hypothetical protein [Lachnospiraceae bacterium]